MLFTEQKKHCFILGEQENNEFISGNKGNRCQLGNTSYMSSSYQGVSWNKGTMRGTMVFISKQENKYQIFNLMGTGEHSKDSVFGNSEHKEIFFFFILEEQWNTPFSVK